MPAICPVKFPYAARDLWFDPNGLDPQRGQNVICETERGQEYGTVSGSPREVDDETLESVTGGNALKPLIRFATPEDDERADELDGLAEEAMGEFQSQVEELGLEMKPVGVEYLFGGEGVVCYFIADNRVDFRQLARNLSRSLQARVDLRQIGVREQAAIMGGIAHCGQEYCCSRLGQGFGPVTIRMAKDQDLPLNSPKISGACGRLMCCLRYEDEAYKDFKRRAPRKNATVETPFGQAKVSEFDTPRETVGLRLEGNRTIRVPLASMECSEAARERCARDGSPCRPDCVSLEALEGLDSPQVKLALAQLRAETELAEQPAIPEEDLLPVETEPAEAPAKSRRRRRGRRNVGTPDESGEKDQEQQAPTRGRRRRRGRLEAPAAPADAAAGEAEPSKPTKDPKDQERREGTPSRRRHHGQRTGQGQGQGQQRRSRQRSNQGQNQGGKPTQKSGDAAATKSQAGEANGKPEAKAQPKSRRQRSPKRSNPQAQQKQQGKQAQQGKQVSQGQRTQQGQQPQKQRPPKDSTAPRTGEDRKPGRARRRRRRHGGGGGNPSGGNPAAGNGGGNPGGGGAGSGGADASGAAGN